MRIWPFSAPGGKSLVNRREFWERRGNPVSAQPEFVTFCQQAFTKKPVAGFATGRRVNRYCGGNSEDLKLAAQAGIETAGQEVDLHCCRSALDYRVAGAVRLEIRGDFLSYEMRRVCSTPDLQNC